VGDLQFTLEIAGIEKKWKKNEAEHPERARGKTVVVRVRREKTDRGEVPASKQVRFLATLRPGERIVVDVAARERAFLELLELTQEQRERAERTEDGEGERERDRDGGEHRDRDREGGDRQQEGEREGPWIPDGLHGFRGMLEGEVAGRQEHGFTLHVTRIHRVWEQSKATSPESAVGKTLLINVSWRQGDDGRWHPVENQEKFVRTLREGEEIRIDVGNLEAERLHILELTQEQRERIR